MGRFLATTAVLGVSVLCAPLATAQTAVPYNWTGFYVGLNVDGSAGDTGVSYPLVGLSGSQPNMAPSGFAGGGQAGYNFQWSSFVFGLEADMQYRDATTSASDPFGNAAGDVTTFNTKQGW